MNRSAIFRLTLSRISCGSAVMRLLRIGTCSREKMTAPRVFLPLASSFPFVFLSYLSFLVGIWAPAVTWLNVTLLLLVSPFLQFRWTCRVVILVQLDMLEILPTGKNQVLLPAPIPLIMTIEAGTPVEPKHMLITPIHRSMAFLLHQFLRRPHPGTKPRSFLKGR